MVSVRQLLAAAVDLPGDSARLESEVLLCHCLGKPRSYLYGWPEAEVEPGQSQRYLELLRARRQGRPLAHLTGEREFWSLSLQVNEHTLIPRPDTETLVQWALELPLPERATVADLGTGSGAIALALATERPGWEVLALDYSAEALQVAGSNAAQLQLHNVTLLRCNWLAGLAGEQFDLLVSNPPYIASGDVHLSEGDLRFEPASALRAGVDGLDALRIIVAQAPAALRAGGWLLLEHGYDQAEAVQTLLRDAGFEAVTSRVDLAGQVRASGGQCRAH
ncbi:MAG: peptide chain release factor N(5)-glutamine methyltransferase [Gammaproteobacteria bacterium]|nr:peptide chain release factor N(5)-glutamine methyltransferase [Gammaproteobacteria bacterium]